MEYSKNSIYLKKEHYEAMLEDVISRVPEEACGLIAGINAVSEMVYIITNKLSSPHRFRMDPEEQLQAFNDIESHNMELLAIYHSHPNGPPGPSPTDIIEFAYPSTVYLIWSKVRNNWLCRGYMISNRSVQEIPVQVIEEE